jgi:DNA-binding transcriptional ArsR family regulator
MGIPDFRSTPISIDEFESHDPEKRRTNAERVVHFLAENRDKAYKAIEIAEATGVDESSIRPVLNRLEERGLVRHREPYWAIGDFEEVQDAMMFSSTATFLDETLGAESREEWLHATEDEERKQS